LADNEGMTGVIADVQRLLLVGPGALDCPRNFGLSRCEPDEKQNGNGGEKYSTPHGSSFVELKVEVKPCMARRPLLAWQFTESQTQYTTSSC
jgi:hypothetical protein